MTLAEKVQDLAEKLGVKIETHPTEPYARAVPTIDEDLGAAAEWQGMDELYEALVARSGEIPGPGPDALRSPFDKKS